MKNLPSKIYYGLPHLRSLVFLIPPLYWFRREIAQALVEEILNLKTRPSSVLEVGFSDAFLTKRLSLILPESRILAIDTSRSSVLRAKRIALKNVDFVCQNFFDIENRFDLVVSMHVFVLFEHEDALEKLRKISNISIISLTGVSPFTVLHRPFHKFFTGMDVNIVEPEKYLSMASKVGLKARVKKVNYFEKSYIVRLERL